MRVHVAYPIPCETKEVWETFKPFVERFARTFSEFPPGLKCTVIALGCEAPVPQEARDMFEDYGLPVHCDTYPGKGMDLGAQQWWANQNIDTFQINMTSRCYFHRAGWLARMYRARLEYGPSLFGCSTSKEGGRFHLCTRAFAYDVDDFNLYPEVIKSRDQGVFFECGEGCLLDWFRSIGREGMLVTWSNETLLKYMGNSYRANGFRHGDQTDMLVWDKHTDIYAEADDEKKGILHRMAYVG